MANVSLGIGGSKSKGKSSSTTNTDSSRTLAEIIQSLGITTQSQQERSQATQTEQQSSLGAESLANLQAMIQQVQAQTTPEAQAGVRDASIAQTLEAGMADIIALGTNAGAYDSTVQGQAGQRLASRAATEGAVAQSQAQQGFLQQLAGLINIEKGANVQATSIMDQLAQLFGQTTASETSSRNLNENIKSKSTTKGKQSGTNMTFDAGFEK